MNLKPLPLSITCLLLAAASAALTAFAAESNETLYTRVFKVPPDFLTSAGVQGNGGAMSVLKSGGISFPQGTSAVFNAATSQLIVRNTKANLDAVGMLAGKLMEKQPSASPAVQAQIPKNVPIYVTVSILIFEVSKSDPLVAQAQAPSVSAKDILQKLTALASRGMARLVTLPAVSTKSGTRAVTKNDDASLEVEPVIGPDGAQASVTGVLKTGEQQLQIKSMLPFGGTAFVGIRDRNSSAELVFMRVFVQSAKP